MRRPHSLTTTEQSCTITLTKPTESRPSRLGPGMLFDKITDRPSRPRNRHHVPSMPKFEPERTEKVPERTWLGPGSGPGFNSRLFLSTSCASMPYAEIQPAQTASQLFFLLPPMQQMASKCNQKPGGCFHHPSSIFHPQSCTFSHARAPECPTFSRPHRHRTEFATPSR